MPASDKNAVVKPSHVCQTCKVRHRKCHWEDDGKGDCLQCKHAGLECQRQPVRKFRHHPLQKALSRASSEVWRPCPLPPAPADFYDETPEVQALYREVREVKQHQQQPVSVPETETEAETARMRRLSLSLSQASSGPIVDYDSGTGERSLVGGMSRVHDPPILYQCLESSLALEYNTSTATATATTTTTDDDDDEDHHHLDTSPLTTGHLTEDFATVTTEAATDVISPLDPVEALLIRNFTDHMALWTDVADPFRTFETVVSQMAFTDLIIRYAVCAFSARHFYRCHADEDGDSKALDYQNRCFNLLIPSMSGGQQITESVLTAVALLRQNEEMDEEDRRFHLEGTSRILNMVPDFSTMGGVGEAACWLCLREDIYISLTTQTPLKTGLDCFPDSVSIRRDDDYSWASRSILNLASLLKRAFCSPRDPELLALSEAEITDWYDSRPASYQPIYFRPRARDEGRVFPEVWMLLPYHAVGLQYYHIAQIVLSAIGPRDVVHTHEYLADSRATARRIRHHLFMVLGLATSNERAENTWFTARHCLSVWGAYLHHPADHMAVLDFLEKWRRRSGWKTSVLVASLRRQWSENMEDD